MNIQQRSVNAVLDDKPTMYEMVRAIKELQDGKAFGEDGTPTKVWKYGAANQSNRLHQWIIQIWEKSHSALRMPSIHPTIRNDNHR